MDRLSCGAVHQRRGLGPVVSRAALLGVVAVAFACVFSAAPASAYVKTYVKRYGPIHMEGFQTQLPKVHVKAPGVSGFIRKMNAVLVYKNGRRVPLSRVMLHHIVFINEGSKRNPKQGSCAGRHGEPFFGTGEEHEQMLLPRDYGYPIRHDDRWRMQTMLMSHSIQPHDVYVKYTVRVVIGEQKKPVVPYWIRANGCETIQPSYTVPGGGGPGSVYRRTWTWKVPMTGHIVAAGGHLHGGAETMQLDEPDCAGRKLFDTDPLYGDPNDTVYRIRPILHEPGPISTRYYLSTPGVSVVKGQKLTLLSDYDNEYARPRVMAIMHVYISPDPTVTQSKLCDPLPPAWLRMLRSGGRTTPPYTKVPLNMLGADGKTVTAVDELPGPFKQYGENATVDLRDGAFTPTKIQIPLGGRVTWRFDDAVAHNVLLANGPAVVGTPTLTHGKSISRQFLKPGKYQLFCYLHPVTMHEEVVVTDNGGSPTGSAGLTNQDASGGATAPPPDQAPAGG
jgi:plastocyanin